MAARFSERLLLWNLLDCEATLYLQTTVVISRKQHDRGGSLLCFPADTHEKNNMEVEYRLSLLVSSLPVLEICLSDLATSGAGFSRITKTLSLAGSKEVGKVKPLVLLDSPDHH